MRSSLFRSVLVLPFVVGAAACPPDVSSEGEGESAEGEGEEAVVYDDIDISFVVDDLPGAAGRNATVFVPESYDGTEALPFVLLLHGYGINGQQMVQFTGFGAIAEENNLIFASPSGTVDQGGNNFWNASGACCDFGGTDVDDSAFLRGIIDAARAKANIDPARIYVVGHSNGGFMAHRMACDHADVIAAVVSLAGAIDPAACEPAEPVAVLQVHGTADETVAYTGGNLGSGNFPSAEDTVAQWALNDSCDDAAVEDAAPLDLATDLAGAETTVTRHENCAPGGAAELWTVAGGKHVVNGGAAMVTRLVTFLFDHHR